MRFQFFWDDPFGSVVAFFYQFFITFVVLTIALTLALQARRRIGRARVGASEPPANPSIDGAGFASEILNVGDASGWTIVRASGPLANFTDPARLELRLAENVAGGRSIEALAIAAHQAGHALQHSRRRWFSQVRVPLILASKLASCVAWLTLLAGALMLSPSLTERAALLYAAIVLGLLLLQVSEADANRRASIAIQEASLDASWTTSEKEAFGKALEAARWGEIASTLPRLRTREG
jgi:uncharacterized protein